MTGAPYRDGLGSASAPEPCGLGPSGAIPSAGEWAVVRASYGYPRVQQIAKVTPKLIKFAGPNWPRQCNRHDLLAHFADKETAELVSQSLAGAAGQREARLRKAREEFEQRRAAAWDAYDEVASRIIAKARGVQS